MNGPKNFPPLEVRVFTRSRGKRTRARGVKVYLFEKSSIGGRDWRERDRVFEENPGMDFLPGLLKNRSTVFITDENGKAFLPIKKTDPLTPEGYGNLIWAESKDGRLRSTVRRVGRDRSGSFWRNEGSAKKIEGRVLEIFLEPSPLVRVLVKDGNGAPVQGVPLGLFYCLSSPEFGRSLLLKGKTDWRGICLFPCVREASKSFGGLKFLWVSFLFPLAEIKENSVRIDASNLGGEPVRLTLPPVGSVQVEVEGSYPSGNGEDVWVALVDSKRGHWDGWSNGWEWYWDRENLLKFSQPVVQGRALFPFVGLGMRLSVFCVKRGVLKIRKKEIAGPSSPGEKVFGRISVPGGDPVISMVLVDEEDRRLGGLDVWIAYPLQVNMNLRYRPHDCYSWGVVRSRKDGRLEFPLPPPFSKGKLSQVELVAEEGRGSGERRVGILDLPPPFSQGRKDIGRVELVFPPLLVSGRVLDHEGNPVAGARVNIWSPVQMGKKGWDCIRRCSTQRDGTFILKGFWYWDRIKIQAYHSSEGGVGPLILPPGSKGVVLHLPGVGSVVGRALIGKPEYIKYNCMKFLLKRVGPGAVGVHGSARKIIRKDGSFLWTGLLEGLYEFHVIVNGEPKEKYSVVDGIRVLPGKTARDPRLRNLDLRGLFEEVRLFVQDEKGQPLKGAYIPGLKVHAFSGNPGILRILVGKGRRPEVGVKARGFQAKMVKLVPGDTIVVRLRQEPHRPPGPKVGGKRENGVSSRGGGF